MNSYHSVVAFSTEGHLARRELSVRRVVSRESQNGMVV